MTHAVFPFRKIALVTIVLLLGGCSVGHYVHLLRGHADLLSRRQPIDELLVAPETPEELRRGLREAKAARQFAVDILRLPDNGSYTHYADLGRPFVQWSVMATPELSLEPRQWCYPMVGCFSYVAYYDPAQAQAQAQELDAAGLETYVGGITAYSTLGWFDDPVLNTMLSGSSERLAGLIFHELAHQRLHVDDDTAFNESLATFVEQQGLREYLRDQPERLQAWQVSADRRQQFAALMLESRTRLESIYATAQDDNGKRQAKAGEFERLRSRYAELRAQWGGGGGFDGWFDVPMNNARLLPFSLYARWVPAFAALYRQAGADWDDFFRHCERLSGMESGARTEALEALRAGDYDVGRTTKSQ